MAHLVVHEEEKEQMDHVLGAVLGQQGPDSHDSAEWNRLFANFCVIINAKRIKHSCQHHIFSDEADVAVPFNFWESMLE